jgi:hypothetical protein
MTDRPIIFSAPMVRALLAGTKTQTRRVLKPQPPTREKFFGAQFSLCPAVAAGVKMYSQNDYERLPKHPTHWDLCGSVGVARNAGFPAVYDARHAIGDRLWVRETWSHTGTGVWEIRDVDHASDGSVVYRADDALADGLVSKWWSPIYMPRRASRLTLTVTSVRVERLHDITEEDAIAEGAIRRRHITASTGGTTLPRPESFSFDCDPITGEELARARTARQSFELLWDKIHGHGSWDANPWVVVITFTKEAA